MLNGYKAPKFLLLGLSIFALSACGGSSSSSGSSAGNAGQGDEATSGHKVSELSEVPASICTGVKSAEFNCESINNCA